MLAEIVKRLTYRGNSLHGDQERVRGQVPRIRKRVLFPQLTEKTLVASQLYMIQNEMSLEKEMDPSR
jgi:hypothetical protein